MARDSRRFIHAYPNEQTARNTESFMFTDIPTSVFHERMALPLHCGKARLATSMIRLSELNVTSTQPPKSTKDVLYVVGRAMVVSMYGLGGQPEP